MKAAILQAANKIVIENIPEPVLGDREVLIKVKATGICGSDVHAYEGIHPRRQPPAILGHELAGDIVEVDRKVAKFKVGERVTVLPRKNCGSCLPCLNDWSNLCDDKVLLGTNDWAGSFAEYIVAPEEVVYRIPDTLSYVNGSLVEPLAVGVHAVKRGKIEFGERVAVLGAGPIGLMCEVCAREAGAKDIIVADLVDYNLNTAKLLGANLVVNNARDDLVSKIKDVYGINSVDIAIIAASAPALLNQAFALVGKRGRIVLVGQFDIPAVIDIERSRLKEQTIIGSSTYCEQDFLEAIKLLAVKKKEFDLLVTHQIAIQELDKGINLIRNRDQDVLKAIVQF